MVLDRANTMVTVSAVGTILLAFVAHKLTITSKSKQIIMSGHSEPFNPELIEASDALSTEEFSIIKDIQEGEPLGKFLKTRHGITHFVINKEEGDDAGNNGVVAMALGIGNDVRRYSELAAAIASEGFIVVSYDYYGHGFSKANDMWIEYSPEVLVDQLEDIVDFVCDQEGKKLVGMVGHSTGGIAVIHANLRWGGEDSKRSVIPKLALVSPALFAKKPFLAKVADAIPTALTALMKKVPSARVLIGNAYCEAGEIAFAKDPDTGKYIYESEYKAKGKEDDRAFGRVAGVPKHPSLSPAILGINVHTLRVDLLPAYSDDFRTMLGRKDEQKCDVFFFWGNLDLTVPFEENNASIRLMAEQNSNLELKVVDRIGHEAISENSSIVAENIITFLKK